MLPDQPGSGGVPDSQRDPRMPASVPSAGAGQIQTDDNGLALMLLALLLAMAAAALNIRRFNRMS
jgi:hypothetical protein